MGDSLDNTDTSVDPTVNLSIANYDAFANYLRKAVTILLPEEDVVPESLNNALDDPVNQDIIRKFLSDPQVQALYIQRNCIKGKKTTYSANQSIGPFAIANTQNGVAWRNFLS